MPRPRSSAQSIEAARTALLEHALSLYLEEGFAGLTLRRLAKRAGTSHTYPYHSFGNKDGLLLALRVYVTKRFVAAILAADPEEPVLPESRLRAMAHAMIEFAQHRTAEYVLLFTLEQPSPDACPELISEREVLSSHVNRVVEKFQARKGREEDPDGLTQILWACIHGLASLHMARQLVHGQSLESLLGPMLDRILAK